ncbi:MAG: flagellar biosynthesis protein FlgL, partial [Jatrophihabitans endophyticus]
MPMAIPSLQFPAASAASLASDLRRLEDRQSDLQTSLASGVRSNSYAGLGGDRQQVLDLTPAISGLRAWQQNVSAAQATLSTSQAAMSRITALATDIGTTLVGL